MTRSTNAPARNRAKRKLIKQAKGYYGDRSNHYRNVKNVLMKAWSYAFRDRRRKKSDFRAIWVQRINAAARVHGISYSRLIDGLTKAKIDVNRKMLALLAIEDNKTFEALVNQAKQALAQ